MRERCPACGGSQWQDGPLLRREVPGGVRLWRYPQCTGCSLRRLDPMPDAATLTEVFDDGYFVDGGGRGGYADYDADASAHLANARHRLTGLDAVGSDAAGPGLLVDIGCASGYTLEAARELGWQAIGVEISQRVAEVARAKGFRVERDLSMLDDLRGEVDVLCWFQVLEHLPDPLAALRAAAELLRPGGQVLIETWDGASRTARGFGGHWQQLSPPSVLWVFSRTSLARLCAEAGLELTAWRPTTKLVSAGLVAGQLAPRLPGAASALVGAVGRRAAGVRVRYGMGDLVRARAVRRLASNP